MSPPGDTPMPTPVAREALNTLQVGSVPIVLIPGIMGSRIHMHFLGHDYDWDPDSTAKMAKFLVMPTGMLCDIFGAPGSVIKADRSQHFPEVAWTYYGPLLEDLKNAFGEKSVYAFGYDWRQSNLDSGRQIASRIENEILKPLKSDKVIIVTRSMGGLVARAAMKFVPGFESKVLGVVHVVQPVHGAAQMYSDCVYRVDAGPGVEGLGLKWILGPFAWQFVAKLPMMPGPVQLLPTNEYHLPSSGAVAHPPSGLSQSVSMTDWVQVYDDEARWGFASDIYDAYASYGAPGILLHWQPIMLPHFIPPIWDSLMDRLEDQIFTAQAFHGELKSYMHPNTKTIVSQQSSTTMLGTIYFIHKTPVIHVTTTRHGQFVGPGDGTVPFESQSALPGTPGWPEPAALCNGAHAEIFKVEAARRYVKQCITAMVASYAVGAKP